MFQISCKKPGFMAGGRVWLDVLEVLEEGQCDDNDVDVYYNTKVKRS